MYSDALRYAGFVVIEVQTAVRLRLACEVRLTAIVTEVGSDHVGSSWDLIERLRTDTRTAAVPIIALGSRMATEERERSKASGASEYFHTPLLPDELVKAIHRVTGATRDV